MILRKGQSEMVGLLVIVILLLVIGVIVLRFSLRPSSSTLADVRSSLESTKILQSLVLVTLQGQSFSEHAQRCSLDQSTCITLRDELKVIFSLILRKGQRYSFFLAEDEDILLTLGDCTVGVMSTYPFTAGGSFYEARLRLC